MNCVDVAAEASAKERDVESWIAKGWQLSTKKYRTNYLKQCKQKHVLPEKLMGTPWKRMVHRIVVACFSFIYVHLYRSSIFKYSNMRGAFCIFLCWFSSFKFDSKLKSFDLVRLTNESLFEIRFFVFSKHWTIQCTNWTISFYCHVLHMWSEKSC